MDLSLKDIFVPLATVAAVVIANRLSRTGSAKEKFWDLRRQAYGVILSELSEIENVFEAAESYIQQSAIRYFEDEDKAYSRHNKQIAKAYVAASKRFSDDYLVLSDEFIIIFERLRLHIEKGESDPNATMDEQHENYRNSVRSIRPELLKQARTEVMAELNQKSWLEKLLGL